MTKICKETNLTTGKAVCYHVFYLRGAGAERGYREVMSFNGFFHSGKSGRNHTKTRLFYLQDDITLDLTKKYFKNIPTVKHKDIWDFYTYIGYDYKRKRYVME